MDLEAKAVRKTFGDFVALDSVDLTVRPGELVALLGPSGSGKTTLLRIIAGLEQATSGLVMFGGEDVNRRSLRQRRVGFVFQHYALFRHMTVFENVAFGLRVKPRAERPSRDEIRERVMRLLHLVQLDPFHKRFPAQLSGGQRQRVALARALAIEPAVLLLDEPFGALDAKVRKELRRWLRSLHDEMQLTSVFVTHDQEEALELADRVVVMNRGRIEQEGAPQDVYDHPATAFAYEFLGNVNRFVCRVDNGSAQFPGGQASLPNGAGQADHPPVAYVRPHNIDIFNGPVMAGTPATVRYVSSAGPLVKVELTIDNGAGANGSGGNGEVPSRVAIVEVELSREQFRHLNLHVGQQVTIRAREARVFPALDHASSVKVTASLH